jgi:hypothetical protein
MSPLLKSPSFLRSLRWTVASTVNAVHFQQGLEVAGQTPVPRELTQTLQTHAAINWAQMAESASFALLYGAQQLAWAALTHPLSTLVVMWWGYESSTLIRSFIRGTRERWRRWRRHRLNLRVNDGE